NLLDDFFFVKLPCNGLNIGFSSHKNSGTSDPTINSGALRLYQNSTKGGSIKIYPQNGVTITKIIFNANLTDGKGPAKYKVTGDTNDYSITNVNGKYTLSNLNVNQILEFFNVGSSSTTRTYVQSIEVTYTLPSTCTSPTTQSTSFSASSIAQTTAQLNWVRGNGDKVLVVGREGGAVNAAPVSGTPYNADPILGFGDQIGTGNFVVYNGNGTGVNLTDLTANKNYHFAIYEYNDTGVCYNLASPLTGNFTTLSCSPSTQSTSFSASNIGQTTAQLNWVRGNGDKVLVVGREGGAVNAAPVSGTSYNADPILGFGDQIGTGNFVVYNGTGTAVNLTDLTANKNYHFAIYEYNDTGVCYNLVSPLTGNFTTLALPPSYFRSKATGNWTSSATWESSLDGITWNNATSSPKSTDQSITIQNGHTVTVNSAVTADEIIIQNGATLSANGSLTVNDGTGDDIIIENDGKIIYTALPNFSGSSTLRVKTGGVLSLQGASLTGSSSVIHSKTIYEHQSILEWKHTSGTPATANITFFPNVDDTTIPIFRFSENANGMGGSNPTTIKGIVEIMSGINISFTGSSTGSKTIRNGIIGLGTFTQNDGGAVIFSGANSEIGQGTTVNFNTSSGLQVDGNLQVKGNVNSGKITNNGSITVKDGANFIHEAYSGTGSFSLEKTTTSNADKYVFWSSPVAEQNMYNLYATASPFVMTYNTTTDYYDTVANPTTSAFGTGYSVKVPANNAPATFTGTPNLGNQTVTLINTANANGNAYNLIGNPYTANLDLADFYLENLDNVGETFYFWVPNVGDNTQNGATATMNPGWAVYNANTTTWSRAASGSNSIIRPGQAFIVKGLTSSASFINDMRTSSNTGVSFFNKNNAAVGEGKYWLQLSLPNQSAYQMAVTYSAGASNNLDASDSKMMSVGNDALYSTVGGEKLAIQGRGSFVNTDVVILGNKHAQNGNYSISLVGKEGLFNNGQAIYLRDKQNGTYTDLSVQDYNFTATAGELTNRFEIVYLPQGSLATTELVKEELKVYKDQEVFIVENTAKIKKITVYDASGRLVKTLTPNANKAVIEGLTKGMYLLNIETQGKVITKKIVK
ncbi:MAG: T9SS type A sorting domain-containing protein, partial [Bacteroidetes bacterium]|nr:T9SS type A sorting domain-containing protein [Bacteroidota bacterium]